MPSLRKKKPGLQVHKVQPRLPGPWQYLDLLPMLGLMRNRFRDVPRAAYPVIALVVWRTIQGERTKQQKALFDAEREAIRRSQHIHIVAPKRRRFIFF
ncbi:MAG TPA: hypothetical protein VM536_13300 [Chloroflexia bacterium]|nr:hypothetical protein [Chloroflexia bacterium]